MMEFAKPRKPANIAGFFYFHVSPEKHGKPRHPRAGRLTRIAGKSLSFKPTLPIMTK
jgi:hypothetical protein